MPTPTIRDSIHLLTDPLTLAARRWLGVNHTNTTTRDPNVFRRAKPFPQLSSSFGALFGRVPECWTHRSFRARAYFPFASSVSKGIGCGSATLA